VVAVGAAKVPVTAAAAEAAKGPAMAVPAGAEAVGTVAAKAVSTRGATAAPQGSRRPAAARRQAAPIPAMREGMASSPARWWCWAIVPRPSPGSRASVSA
jgi:hypothetical protein